MGFFSWVKSDDGEPVWNAYTRTGATPCKVLCPDGREIIERNYQGYGTFGGILWHDLVAEYCGEGDALEFERRARAGENLPVPKIVSIDYDGTWEDVPYSEWHENQGYWGRET